MEFQAPAIDLNLSLDQETFDFSQPLPPTFTVTATSHASTPITIFTWRTPLDPATGLISKAFTITDSTTQKQVQTSEVKVQRLPFQRTRGSPDTKYLCTLEPNVPVQLSAPFGRPGRKPQPKAIAERGWELDEHGREMKLRRSMFATGVDGLEPGHEYKVDVNTESLRNCLWTSTNIDEILVDQNGSGSDMHSYPWTKGSLTFRTNGPVFSVAP